MFGALLSSQQGVFHPDLFRLLHQFLADVPSCRELAAASPQSLIGPLAPLVSGLLDHAINDRDRTLQLEALHCLEELARVIRSPDVIATFLPGISVALFKVITGDVKQGTPVLSLAVTVWGRLTARAFSDQANGCVLRATEASPSTVTSFRGFLGGFKQRTSTPPALPPPTEASGHSPADGVMPDVVCRTRDWFLTSQRHILQQVDALFGEPDTNAPPLVLPRLTARPPAEPTPGFRRAMVVTLWRLLSACSSSLQPAVPVLIDYLLKESGSAADAQPSRAPLPTPTPALPASAPGEWLDDLPRDLVDSHSTEVAPLAQYLLHQRLPALFTDGAGPAGGGNTSRTALLEMLAERMEGLVRQLPRVLSGTDGRRQGSIIRRLLGYLQVMPPAATERVLVPHKEALFAGLLTGLSPSLYAPLRPKADARVTLLPSGWERTPSSAPAGASVSPKEAASGRPGTGASWFATHLRFERMSDPALVGGIEAVWRSLGRWSTTRLSLLPALTALLRHTRSPAPPPAPSVPHRPQGGAGTSLLLVPDAPVGPDPALWADMGVGTPAVIALVQMLEGAAQATAAPLAGLAAGFSASAAAPAPTAGAAEAADEIAGALDALLADEVWGAGPAPAPDGVARPADGPLAGGPAQTVRGLVLCGAAQRLVELLTDLLPYGTLAPAAAPGPDGSPGRRLPVAVGHPLGPLMPRLINRLLEHLCASDIALNGAAREALVTLALRTACEPPERPAARPTAATLLQYLVVSNMDYITDLACRQLRFPGLDPHVMSILRAVFSTLSATESADALEQQQQQQPLPRPTLDGPAARGAAELRPPGASSSHPHVAPLLRDLAAALLRALPNPSLSAAGPLGVLPGALAQRLREEEHGRLEALWSAIRQLALATAVLLLAHSRTAAQEKRRADLERAWAAFMGPLGHGPARPAAPPGPEERAPPGVGAGCHQGSKRRRYGCPGAAETADLDALWEAFVRQSEAAPRGAAASAAAAPAGADDTADDRAEPEEPRTIEGIRHFWRQYHAQQDKDREHPPEVSFPEDEDPSAKLDVPTQIFREILMRLLQSGTHHLAHGNPAVRGAVLDAVVLAAAALTGHPEVLGQLALCKDMPLFAPLRIPSAPRRSPLGRSSAAAPGSGADDEQGDSHSSGGPSDDGAVDEGQSGEEEEAAQAQAERGRPCHRIGTQGRWHGHGSLVRCHVERPFGVLPPGPESAPPPKDFLPAVHALWPLLAAMLVSPDPTAGTAAGPSTDALRVIGVLAAICPDFLTARLHTGPSRGAWGGDHLVFLFLFFFLSAAPDVWPAVVRLLEETHPAPAPAPAPTPLRWSSSRPPSGEAALSLEGRADGAGAGAPPPLFPLCPRCRMVRADRGLLAALREPPEEEPRPASQHPRARRSPAGPPPAALDRLTRARVGAALFVGDLARLAATRPRRYQALLEGDLTLAPPDFPIRLLAERTLAPSPADPSPSRWPEFQRAPLPARKMGVRTALFGALLPATLPPPATSSAPSSSEGPLSGLPGVALASCGALLAAGASQTEAAEWLGQASRFWCTALSAPAPPAARPEGPSGTGRVARALREVLEAEAVLAHRCPSAGPPCPVCLLCAPSPSADPPAPPGADAAQPGQQDTSRPA
ncbi:hypothetical protein PAPYR_1911 [Paratrimastix pyriformis]|uniref:TTI1 N-terminal TPR domain-containing protein n=1 Tax=Paratrimastix pyriformis TaxID=342808 RepID=A0ABQ8URK2_9EUKA|nr:hypothetical protein PAPYR_1911 [Paratrimastix pyriformis]